MRARWILPCLLTLASAPVASAADPPVATIGVGVEACWDGLDRPLVGGTRTYTVAVTGAGEQLRIALDRRDFSVGMEIESPAGATYFGSGGWYGIEAFIDDPQPGTWTIRASGGSQPQPFRFRARLDGAPAPAPSPAVQTLPNLRMVPPFQFTFASPAFLGSTLTNCSLQEVVETSARSCLRFSTGPGNDGAGPLFVRFEPLEGLVTSGTAYQRVFNSDGTYTERPAGTYEYHKTHMHYHHSGFGKLELLRVLDAETGAMSLAGEGPKQGFCTGDVVMFDWFDFTQPRHPVDSSCVDEATFTGTNRPVGTTMALNTGWADLYSWSQDGMYVEWSNGGDGVYVVRITADSKDWILESNEDDNASYAMIRVDGGAITVLERGLGTDPWDPSRVLVYDRFAPTT